MEEIKEYIYKEIKELSLEQLGYQPSTAICPSCGGQMLHGLIPCPDNRAGCLVLHYGYVCEKCNKKFS